MTKTQTATHTPGPWFVKPARELNERDICTTPVNTLGQFVATAWGGGAMDDAVDANARLIAAAPELLAALKEVERAFNMAMVRLAISCGTENSTIANRMRAAIAKAEGE